MKIYPSLYAPSFLYSFVLAKTELVPIALSQAMSPVCCAMGKVLSFVISISTMALKNGYILLAIVVKRGKYTISNK